MESRVTILMRVVISKVLAGNMAFESRLESSGGAILGICLPGRGNSICRDFQLKDTYKVRNREARVE